jgi:transcriptional regulator GlxA family with amidase domain
MASAINALDDIHGGARQHGDLRQDAAVAREPADSGSVITGGGVTLCIDTMLHLTALRYGSHAADEVARIMEYGAARAANAARLPQFA